MSNTDQENDETYSEEETKRRADAALKRMLQTPNYPQIYKSTLPRWLLRML